MILDRLFGSLICRVCKRPIRFWQETMEDKYGERYHYECFNSFIGFISWDVKQ